MILILFFFYCLRVCAGWGAVGGGFIYFLSDLVGTSSSLSERRCKWWNSVFQNLTLKRFFFPPHKNILESFFHFFPLLGGKLTQKGEILRSGGNIHPIPQTSTVVLGVVAAWFSFLRTAGKVG